MGRQDRKAFGFEMYIIPEKTAQHSPAARDASRPAPNGMLRDGGDDAVDADRWTAGVEQESIDVYQN